MQMTRPVVGVGRALLAGILILIVAVFGSTTVWAQTQAKPATTTASTVAPAAPNVPPVDVESSAEASNVRLLVGKSTLIDNGSPIARVSLTSADIADALVTSPSQLLVHGKTPGSISMFVWSRSGGVRRYEIAVQRDLAKLSDQLKELFPNEHIDVRSNGHNVVLAGTVKDKETADKALTVATSFVDKKDEVVSTLQVGPAGASNQVLLRVRFAEVSRNALTEFGMAFFTSPTGIKNNIGRVTTQQFPAPNFSDLETKKTGPDAFDFGGEVTSASGKFAFSDFLNFFLLNEKYDLGTVIRAMQSRGLFQSLAEPNLVAESGKEASFLAGGEFPVPIAQGSGANIAISVMFKEFGIRLNFTPTVAGERVHLKVRPEVSTLDFGNAIVLSGFRIPALSTRRTETELELRNGQTFAIAGLMNNKMQSTLQKVPGIGDIPILGQLFRSRAAQKEQTELVVMITPEILPANSDGVTRDLPRLGQPYLAPLQEKRSLPAPPPAFRSGSRPGAANVAPAPLTPEAEHAQDQAAYRAADSDLKTVGREQRALSEQERKDAKKAKEYARRQQAEQERQDKFAAEQSKKDLEAANRAQIENARRAAISQKEQEKLAREQAKRDAAEAKRQAEQAKKQQEEAARTKGDKRVSEREDERQRAIASAEARLRAAEAEYQAQVSKEAAR
jgi:pilus assembly protein CpaC